MPHTLSIAGTTLKIANGNEVVLPDQIQDLTLGIDNMLTLSRSTLPPVDLTRFLDDKQELNFNSADSTLTITNGTKIIDLSIFNQALTFNPATSILSISNSLKTVDLSSLKNDADYSITNEIQDLTYNPTSMELSLTGSTPGAVSLSNLKDDADPSPTNEIQTISYEPDNFKLLLNNGGGFATIGQIVAFKAGIASTINLPNSVQVPLLFDQVTGGYYTDGSYYNPTSGIFDSPFTGIYSFSISINLPAACSVILKVTGIADETLIGPTGSLGIYKQDITLKLNKGDDVSIFVIQTNGYPIPFSFSGYSSGYRVY